MIGRRLYLLMWTVFACLAFTAAAQQAQEDLEPQRARVRTIRKNAEDYARLRENVNAFLNHKNKEAIHKLDHDLHAMTQAKQERYQKVLTNYADWLDRLKKTDPNTFKAIANAPDAATRLALIREQRDREWMEKQPKAQREQWAKLQGEPRTKFVAEKRQEERTRHQHWLVSSRFWKELETKQTLPARLADFAYKSKKGAKDKDTGKAKEIVDVNPVKDHVDQYLLPYLSPVEKKQLEDAEGRWPDYPIVLVGIASKHPTALPMKPEPTKFEDLPKSVRNRFNKKDVAKAGKFVKEIKQFEGPLFARKFAEIARESGAAPFGKQPEGNEYMVTVFKNLTPPMQKFVKEELIPAVKENAADMRTLSSSDGHWPDYPLAIQDLSIKYNLRPPWFILPDGDRYHWDRYRPEKFVAPEPEKKANDKEAE